MDVSAVPGAQTRAQFTPFITKLVPPRRRPDLIRRERVVQALRRGMKRHRAALVTAPAGYGKTSLLADCLADLDYPLCWYSVDPGDADLRSFFGCVVAALQTRFPEFGARTSNLLDSSLDPAADASALVGTLVTEIQQDIPVWFVLVLEDLHWCEDQASLAALDLLIRRLPENCFLILSSRARPSLPALSRLVAQRSLTRLSARDLAFTEAEVVEWLQASGHDGDRDLAAQLTARCEGWIAGIILTAQWLDERPSASAPEDGLSHQELFQFMADDVFERLPQRWQEFLVQTSVVRDVAPDLCAEAFDYAGAPALLEEMENAGLLVTALGTSGVYRYHALFREFLLDRARADRQNFTAWQSAAAHYFERRKRWEEAVEHYLAADAPHEAGRVLLGCAPELYEQGRWAVLAQLMKRVREQAVEVDFRLTLWRARCAVQLGDHDGALALAAEVEASAAGLADPLAVAGVQIVRAAAFRARGSCDEAISAAEGALSALKGAGKGPQVRLLRAEAHHYVGVALQTQGRRREALAALEEALRLYSVGGHLYHLARVHTNLGGTLARLGQYAAAIVHYERAVDGNRRLGNTAVLASTMNNLGNLYLTIGSFALAEDILNSALDAARASGSLRVQAYATQSLADALSGQGRYDDAAPLYQVAIERFREAGESVNEARTTTALARAYAHLRRFGEAESLLDRAGAMLGRNHSEYDCGLLCISQALIKVLGGDFSSGRQPLQQALEHFSASGDQRWAERTALLLAQTLHRLDDHDTAGAALDYLREAAASEIGPSALRRECALANDVLRSACSQLPDGSVFTRLLAAADAELVSPAGIPLVGGTRPSEKPVIRAFGLGSSIVQRDGRLLGEAQGITAKSKELLFYLLTVGRPVRREELFDALWPESDSFKDSSVLRTNVYRLRQALYGDCVVNHSEYYQVDPGGHFWFDAHEFAELEKRARQADCSPSERVLALETAVRLYRGPFVEESYAEWCSAERTGLEIRFVSALVDLACLHLELGSPSLAVPLCERALSVEPFHEQAVCTLIRAHAASGNHAAATSQWRLFERQMRAEMGQGPSPGLIRQCQELMRSA